MSERLLIKIPTRSRGLHFLIKYVENITNPNTKILVSLDWDDYKTIAQIINHEHENVIYRTSASSSKVEAINRDIAEFENEFDFLCVCADDIVPQVKGFDDMIIQGFNSTKKDVLWLFDGFRKDLITIPIMRIGYYQQFGYVYHPSYKSLWCDNEFQDVAEKKKQIEKYRFSETILKHCHPVNVGGYFDHLLRKNDMYFKIDKKNYEERKKKGFV